MSFRSYVIPRDLRTIIRAKHPIKHVIQSRKGAKNPYFWDSTHPKEKRIAPKGIPSGPTGVTALAMTVILLHMRFNSVLLNLVDDYPLSQLR